MRQQWTEERDAIVARLNAIRRQRDALRKEAFHLNGRLRKFVCMETLQSRADRDAAIVRGFAQGETVSALARRFGITRQRVNQILRREGVPAKQRRVPVAEVREGA